MEELLLVLHIEFKLLKIRIKFLCFKKGKLYNLGAILNLLLNKDTFIIWKEELHLLDYIYIFIFHIFIFLLYLYKI